MKKIEEIRNLQQKFHNINSKYKSLKSKRKDLKDSQINLYLPIIRIMHEAEKEAIRGSDVNAGVNTSFRSPNSLVKPLSRPSDNNYYSEFKIKKSNFRKRFLRLKYQFEESCGCGEYDNIYATVKIPLSYFDMTEEEIKKVHYDWFMGICNKIISKRAEKAKEEKLKKDVESLERRKKQYTKLKEEFEA